MFVAPCCRPVIHCFVVITSILSCAAWQKMTFKPDPQLVDKVILSDAAVTHRDVSDLRCAMLCAWRYPCSYFSYHSADRNCVLCGICSNLTFVDAPGYQLFVARTDAVDSLYKEHNLCPNSTLKATPCWQQTTGSLTDISVGPAGAWGVDSLLKIYYRENTYQNAEASGDTWINVDGGLVQLAVGTDIVWGTFSTNTIWYRIDIQSSSPTGFSWGNPGGGITWISVSLWGSVWAVNTNGQLVHYRQSSNAHPVGTAWDVMAPDAQQVDAGQAGVWMLNNTGHLFYREGTYGDKGSTGTGWQHVEGTFRSVSSGTDLLVTVDNDGHVWIRTGMSSDTPAGLAWVPYPGYVKMIDVYQSNGVAGLWAVDFNESVYFSTLHY